MANIGTLKVMLDRIIIDDEAPQAGDLQEMSVVLNGLAGWFRIGDG